MDYFSEREAIGHGTTYLKQYDYSINQQAPATDVKGRQELESS